MSQEQKLFGFVKGFAQRLSAATEVPSLKEFSKTVTNSVSGYNARSKSAANNLLKKVSTSISKSPRQTPCINDINTVSSSGIVGSMAYHLSDNHSDVWTKDRHVVPFEETMRDAYVSVYDVTKFSSMDSSSESVTYPVAKAEQSKSEKDIASVAGSLLKEIFPPSKSAKKEVTHATPVVSKASIDSRTRALIQCLRGAKSSVSHLTRIEDLSQHLLKFPDAKFEAVRCGAIPLLLNVVLNGDTVLKSQCCLTLSLLGYSFPPDAPGPRILSVDGGGARGLVALEVLRELESLTGKAPCDLFDYFIGVSTGSVVVAMLAAFKLSAEESVEYYKRICNKLFARDNLGGARRLLLSHGYYDSTAWENELRSNMGEKLMVDLSRSLRSVRMAVVSTKIDEPDCSPYVFRSYEVPCGSQSHYEGSLKYKIWEAVRASSAAPGFFSEFRLDNTIHHDGGILNNNPTAIGLHESRLLWPKERLCAVVSMGTGRFRKSQEVHNRDVAKAVGLTSWRSKLTSIIASATDTEGIHTTLQDLLPPSTYFRIQPILSEDLGMDVDDPEKMDVLIKDSRKFVKDNPVLMRQIAKKLTMPRSALRKANDWMTLQKDSTEFHQYNKRWE